MLEWGRCDWEIEVERWRCVHKVCVVGSGSCSREVEVKVCEVCVMDGCSCSWEVKVEVCVRYVYSIDQPVPIMQTAIINDPSLFENIHLNAWHSRHFS